MSQRRKEKKAGKKEKTKQVKMGDPGCPRNLYGFYSVSSLHAAWDPLYFQPKLLEKASFKLEPQNERSVLPRIL